MNTEAHGHNVDADEIAQFDRVAANWWDPHGEMAPLHVVNPVRLHYLQQRVGELAGKRALDVGCGGGLLAEAMAAAGAEVTGIDLAEQALAVARDHAAEHGLAVEYLARSAEALAAERAGHYELVCCMEMLEHVPDPAAVVTACARLARPGGHVVFSTINRNPKSFLLAIVGAEYLLRLLPRGTHDYAKFIRPSELTDWARAAELEPDDAVGLRYNPLLKSASLAPHDLDVNYLLHCLKPQLASDDRRC